MPEEKASSAILAIDSDRIPLSPTRTQTIIPALKTRFIINPRSGRVQRHLANIQTFARRRGMETVCSESPGHATELARIAISDGCERIVAVGGDGTMNEVGRTLIGTPVTLALVPCGSGDGLGRHLGIHGPIDRALSLLETGQTRTIDSGTAAGHPFLNVAGLGLEAELAHRFRASRVRGLLGYLSHGLAVVRQLPAEHVRITAEGRETGFLASTLAVANGDQYGNDAFIAPSARCDDGQLELSALPPLNCRRVLRLGFRLFRGTLNRDRRVLRQRARAFTVRRANAGLIHTDGETHFAPATVDFCVLPASLRVLCP